MTADEEIALVHKIIAMLPDEPKSRLAILSFSLDMVAEDIGFDEQTVIGGFAAAVRLRRAESAEILARRTNAN